MRPSRSPAPTSTSGSPAAFLVHHVDVAASGSAEAAAVDALDEQAIDQHLQSATDKAGRVDISFSAVGIPDAELLGVPLVELDLERFSLPIGTYTRRSWRTSGELFGGLTIGARG